MKSFDLTFSGTVLPEHDPSQVKLGFAKLFCIEDTARLEELFSGKTIVLRQNLDRKTAAEYFSKIAELGGKAALVESAETRDNDTAATTIERESARNSRERRSERRQMARRIAPIMQAPVQLGIEEKANTQSILSEHSDELVRLRILMSQMKERSRQRYLALQSRKEAFLRIADQELALIEQASKEAILRAQSGLATFKSEDEQLKQHADEEFSRLELEQHNRRTRSLDEVASLETLKQEARDRELALIADIEARREATRSSAAQEIARLQQLLLDTQRKAEIEDAALVQALQEAKSSTLDTLEALEQQRTKSLGSLEQDINSLLQQQAEAKLRFESDTAEQQRRQQEFQHQCGEHSSTLHTQQLEIKNKRDRGIAEVDKASAQLEDMTRKTLKKLYAMELLAKRRHNDAMAKLQNRDLLGAKFPEITSH